MTRGNVRLNHAGLAAIAKSPEMRKMVKDAADRIADQVRGQHIRVGDRDGGPREYELPVTVTEVITDRAHASVALAHPAGIAVQAKHGALTKAAAAEGLTVR
jgi:hypothetical protein